MKQRKHVVLIMALVMIAVIALSVNTALAGGIERNKFSPSPPSHAPVCYKVESFVPAPLELNCYDTGKDIIGVNVMTNMKYEVEWNADYVVIRFFNTDKEGSAIYSIRDKAGNVTTGTIR